MLRHDQMILPLMLLHATAQAPDTNELRVAFYRALVAAVEAIKHDIPRVASVAHVEVEYKTFKAVAGLGPNDTTNWTRLASAVGSAGVAERTTSCGGEDAVCPSISAQKLERVGDVFTITLALNRSRYFSGTPRPSYQEYVVTLVRNGHEFTVRSVKRGDQG